LAGNYNFNESGGPPFVEGIVEGAYSLTWTADYMKGSYHIDGAMKNDGAYIHAGNAYQWYGNGRPPNGYIGCVGISEAGGWTAFKAFMSDLGFKDVGAFVIFKDAPKPGLIDSGGRWNP
jgi:hypothetical protein